MRQILVICTLLCALVSWPTSGHAQTGKMIKEGIAKALISSGVRNYQRFEQNRLASQSVVAKQQQQKELLRRQQLYASLQHSIAARNDAAKKAAPQVQLPMRTPAKPIRVSAIPADTMFMDSTLMRLINKYESAEVKIESLSDDDS